MRRLGLQRAPSGPGDPGDPRDPRDPSTPSEPPAAAGPEAQLAGDEPESGAAAARRVRVARSSALSLALLAAVLLSTPAWFAAFAWATGQSASTLAAIALLLATGYAFGIAQLGPLARAVTVAPAAGHVADPGAEASGPRGR